MPSKLWGNWCSRANMTDSWFDYGFYTQTILPQPGSLETPPMEQTPCPRLTWKSGDISWFKNPQNFEGFVFQFAGRIWYISIRKVTDGTWGASSQQLVDTLYLSRAALTVFGMIYSILHRWMLSASKKASVFQDTVSRSAGRAGLLLTISSYMSGRTHHRYNVIASKYKLSNAFFCSFMC